MEEARGFLMTLLPSKQLACDSQYVLEYLTDMALLQQFLICGSHF